VSCVYDDDGRVTSQTTTDAGPVARAEAVTHDDYGNPHELRHTVAGTVVKDTTTSFDSLVPCQGSWRLSPRTRCGYSRCAKCGGSCPGVSCGRTSLKVAKGSLTCSASSATLAISH